MTNAARSLVLLVCLAACARETPQVAEEMPAQPPASTGPETSTDRTVVAMSAAPMALSAGAAIAEIDAAGKITELRAGKNGWLCLADDTPTAPGDSPDCLDPTWQQWFDAYAKGEAPRISGVGIAYMLQGGLSPSNTDPMAETPPAGQMWMEDGAHVMVIVPDNKLLKGFPTEHRADGPYVMYAGTPYAHLMIPVAGH